MDSGRSLCYLRLAIQAQQVAFEVGLNDLPLVSLAVPGNARTDFGVNEFTTGEDALWVRLRGAGTLTATLYLADPEKPEPTPLRVLATLAYPADLARFGQESSGTEGRECWVGRLPVDYGKPPLPLPVAPFWQQAERLGPQLSPARQQELFRLLESVRGLVLARNAEGVSRALAYKTRDVALANYHDPAEQMQIVRREVEGVFQGNGEVSGVALDPDRIEWVVGAGQRVVLARQTQTYAMPLSFEVDGIEFAMECYFGRVGGTWLLVR